MHSLHGFIAIEDVAREFEHSFNEGTPPVAKSIGLPQGFGLVPMTPALRARLTDVTGEGNTPFDVFSELTASAVWVAETLSEVGKVVYIQIDSDTGLQSAMVWEFGKIIYDPRRSDVAANEALKLLGVNVESAANECAELGLSDHPTTEAWYQAALKYQVAVPDIEFDED